MNFKDLVERHPEVTHDRRSLSFSKDSRPDEIAAAFSSGGVVMLKDALPPAMLETCGEVFQHFIRSDERRQPMPRTGQAGRSREVRDGEAMGGSWHSPWAVRDGDRFPAAMVMSAVIGSWTWNVVEELCGSSHIVVLLKWCTARHSVDRPLGIGAHQDAKVVATEVPFSLWIPFNRIVPGLNSGLGFVVPAPNGLLPTPSHDDVGADYVLNDPARLWIPPYAAGDLTVHSRFSPHFTTGYGTLSDRFSLEIRAMPRHAAPSQYVDPAIYVSRRNGIPTIVTTRNSSDDDAEEFLACADLASVTSKAGRKAPV